LLKPAFNPIALTQFIPERLLNKQIELILQFDRKKRTTNKSDNDDKTEIL